MTFTGRGLYAASSKVPRGRRSGWLVIGAVVALAVLLGGALAAFGSVQVGGDTRSDDFTGAKKVEIHSGSGVDVEVHRVEGDAVTVERTLRGTPLAEPRERLDMDGGTVKAEVSCSGSWFFSGCEIEYSVGVPEGTAVAVEATSGDIELAGTTGGVDAESASGSISGENLSGGIHAATTTGDIDLSGVEGDLDVETNTGSVDAEGSGGTVTAETTTGRMDLDEFTAERFDIETTTGGVELDAGFAEARIETTTGSVDVEAVEEFRRLDVDTTTGSVEVQVPEGAYRVTGDSATGDRDIDVETSADGGGPQIAVSTTTGSVEVRADD
ncbi:hypothetical protein LP52_16810 [Streptomonospora alba]|uniref:DUF4097 domain-containing protein n=1 Tax=Streptomonospora alba TaxID=183763 RepID=A0A0C2G350_9ACTN|nr:DUF4097 family beta strand repeat-containing protein [Streptomonospora alba]KIH97723.1 hypothetical protein LP52_16810 [Streptomonospora alba]